MDHCLHLSTKLLPRWYAFLQRGEALRGRRQESVAFNWSGSVPWWQRPFLTLRTIQTRMSAGRWNGSFLVADGGSFKPDTGVTCAVNWDVATSLSAAHPKSRRGTLATLNARRSVAPSMKTTQGTSVGPIPSAALHLTV